MSDHGRANHKERYATPCPTCAENAKELEAARRLKKWAQDHKRLMREGGVFAFYTSERGLDSLLEAIKDE